MLNLRGPEGDLGVIVARFQTPYLTEGHRELIDSVAARHNKFAIVLGVANVVPTVKNPLDFATRYRMLQDTYPGVEVLAINDVRSDDLWSHNLDRMIRLLHPHEKVVLYGSRDSFITHYTGRFQTAELDEIHGINATLARKQAYHTVRPSEDFRRGVIYATANKYPSHALCVDVAVVDFRKAARVLLGRKKEDPEGQWRFFGGHVNPGEKAKHAGVREVTEEAGCTIGEMEYVDDTPIDDWRYNGTKDGAYTIFYVGHYLSGPVRAGDDVDEVKWFDMVLLEEAMIVKEHHVLLDALLRKYSLRGDENHGEVTSEYTDVRKFSFNHVDGKKVYAGPVPAENVNWSDTKMSLEGLDKGTWSDKL
jgi:bifunctional NMN adenylyltransferase/nudix hydrolase